MTTIYCPACGSSFRYTGPLDIGPGWTAEFECAVCKGKIRVEFYFIEIIEADNSGGGTTPGEG